MQQQPDLTQSQKAQPNERFYSQIEQAAQNFAQAVEAEARSLHDEDSLIYSKQWSLLKFVFNHPENIDIISNHEWFDLEQRSIFDKLQGYVQFLKKQGELLNKDILLGCFDNADRFYLESEIEQAKEPEGLFNAQRLCDELMTAYNRRQRFFASLQILLAKDKETASLYARQLTNISEPAPVHAKIFGTDTKLPKTSFTLKKDGVPILEDQNFYVIMGKEKSGKSHLLPVFIAAYLFGSLKSFGLESLLEPNSKILYMDTEQTSSDAHNICQTANLLAGRKYDARNESLIIASCDEVPPGQMLNELKLQIATHKPKIVFIDGYAGLLEDAYKNTGADPLMREIRTIARRNDLIIIGVFHTKTDTSNPLSSKEDSVTAFGAFGKLSQKYGGGTFLVENKEGLVSVTNIQSRKSKCPDIYFKLDGRIYIDDPEGGEPETCEVIDGNTDEVLVPRHKNINDNDVHSFAIPRSLSEGEYNEAEDVTEIERERKEEVRKAQKAETKLKTKISEYEEIFGSIFHSNDEHLTDTELLERWREWYKNKHKDEYLPNEPFKDTSNIRKLRSRQYGEARKLGILFTLPSGSNGFKIVSSQQVPS